MVIDYLKDVFNVNIDNLEAGEIAKIIGTDIDGTLIDDVKKMNRNKKILKAQPSIEFRIKYLCKISDIESEINDGKPVIVCIFLSDNHRGFEHSVVITGIDLENNLIFYNDPIQGEVQEEIGTFNAAWEEADSLMIKVEIGKRTQREILEYTNRDNIKRRERKSE